MTAPRCENSLGRRGPCNERLRVEISPLGAVVYRCVRCEARAAGRCWNCGKPRTNHPVRGTFCDPCGYAAYRLAQRRAMSSPEQRRRQQAYDRRRWKDAEARARKEATRRAWLEQHPEKPKEYKRRDRERQKARAALERQARRETHHFAPAEGAA